MEDLARVSKTGANVVGFQGRVGIQDLLLRPAGSEEIYNHLDGYPGASNDRLADKDFRVNSNAIAPVHAFTIADLRSSIAHTPGVNYQIMSNLHSRRSFLTGSVAAAGLAGSSALADSRPKTWEGIFVIMQTPFLETLEIDEDSLRKETDFLCRCGAHGIVWPAGAGETTSIWYRERLRFSESVVKEARGRTTVLIGVHGANKFEAVEYARHAEKIGADGIHALGPGDGSSDPDILADYFQAIASASRLPLSIQVSTPGMTPQFLMALAEKIPTFRIAKLEGARTPHDVTLLVKQGKRRLIPSTGGGAMNLINEIERNSGGTMAGAGLADIQAEIWDQYHAGKKREARDLFSKFLLAAVLERQTGYVLQKEILRRRRIFNTVTMRSTRKFSMDEGDLRELDAIMEVLRPHFRV